MFEQEVHLRFFVFQSHSKQQIGKVFLQLFFHKTILFRRDRFEVYEPNQFRGKVVVQEVFGCFDVRKGCLKEPVVRVVRYLQGSDPFFLASFILS